jgi:hypothetical protein
MPPAGRVGRTVQFGLAKRDGGNRYVICPVGQPLPGANLEKH